MTSLAGSRVGNETDEVFSLCSPDPNRSLLDASSTSLEGVAA